MKHGCIVMTLRLSSSRRSGSRQIHRRRKKRLKFAAMSRPSWSFRRHPRHCPQGFVPPGQTGNGKFYCEVLKRLREGTRRRRPDKWKNSNWFLHQDNALTHTSLVVRQFLTSKNITVIPSLYSPDLAALRLFAIPPRWNYGWKGVVLTRLRRSTQNRKGLSIHSHLRTSRDARNHRKHAGIAVYMPKGTTSKETVETRSYDKEHFFMVKFPEYFGSTSYLLRSVT